MRLLSLGIPKAGSLPDTSGARGVVLSHLIGFAVVVQFLLDRAITFSLPYNRLVDLPIRLILVWLILDRVGRVGQRKLTPWDIAQLGFVAAHGIASVYADLFMARDAGLINYIEWILQTIQPFFYFLAIREGLSRKGFRPDIVINWIIVTIVVACAIAMLQALDLGGMRKRIDDFYDQRRTEAMLEGASAPWQARGITAHANAMAMLILVGFTSLVASVGYRKLGWFELISGMIFLGTLFATYSRTGIVTLVTMAMGFILMLFIQKKYREAFLSISVLACLLLAFLVSVEVFDIQRYKVFTKGVGVVKNEESRGLWGWYQRQKVLRDSVKLMEKYPVTGVTAASGALNRQRLIIHSPYTIEGQLLNIYGFSVTAYGMYGLAFVFGTLGICFYQLKYVRSNRAFAAAAFFAGLVLAVSGMSENTLFNMHSMVVVNCIMAFGLSALQRRSDSRPDPLMILKSKFLRTA